MLIKLIFSSSLLIFIIGCTNQPTDPTSSDASERPPDTIAAVGQTPYDRALQYAEAGDPALLALCDSLLQLDSVQAGASPYYYRGIYHATRKEIKEAIGFFDKTIVADYRFLDAYIEKAALLYDLNKPALALQELELARTISPGYAPTHYWIAKVHESRGITDKALEHYRLTLSLDSTFREARQGIERLEK